MELLDRAFQRMLLHVVAEAYPHATDVETAFGQYNPRQVEYNLQYLKEHGLIKFEIKRNGEDYTFSPLFATAKGIDFLADDGGLTAVLGVVTVRLHADTVRDLLIERVKSSDTPDGVKKSVVDAIRKLPAQALEKLSLAAAEEGLKHIPDAIAWLQAFF